MASKTNWCQYGLASSCGCLSELAVLTPCCMHTQGHETRLWFLRSRLLYVHNGLPAVSIG